MAETPTMVPFRFGRNNVILHTIVVTINRIPAVAALANVERMAESIPRNTDENPPKTTMIKISFKPGTAYRLNSKVKPISPIKIKSRKGV